MGSVLLQHFGLMTRRSAMRPKSRHHDRWRRSQRRFVRTPDPSRVSPDAAPLLVHERRPGAGVSGPPQRLAREGASSRSLGRLQRGVRHVRGRWSWRPQTSASPAAGASMKRGSSTKGDGASGRGGVRRIEGRSPRSSRASKSASQKEKPSVTNMSRSLASRGPESVVTRCSAPTLSVVFDSGSSR